MGTICCRAQKTQTWACPSAGRGSAILAKGAVTSVSGPDEALGRECRNESARGVTRRADGAAISVSTRPAYGTPEREGRHSGFRRRGRCCFRLPLPRQLLRISIALGSSCRRADRAIGEPRLVPFLGVTWLLQGLPTCPPTHNPLELLLLSNKQTREALEHLDPLALRLPGTKRPQLHSSAGVLLCRLRT